MLSYVPIKNSISGNFLRISIEEKNIFWDKFTHYIILFTNRVKLLLVVLFFEIFNIF